MSVIASQKIIFFCVLRYYICPGTKALGSRLYLQFANSVNMESRIQDVRNVFKWYTQMADELFSHGSYVITTEQNSGTGSLNLFIQVLNS